MIRSRNLILVLIQGFQIRYFNLKKQKQSKRFLKVLKSTMNYPLQKLFLLVFIGVGTKPAGKVKPGILCIIYYPKVAPLPKPREPGDVGLEQLISNRERFNPAFAKRDKKQTMIDLRPRNLNKLVQKPVMSLHKAS
jgi:hypothetical protein